MNLALIKGRETPNLFSFLKYLNERRKSDMLYYKRFAALKKIMKYQALDTFFQPIVDLKTEETFAFEALNRPGMVNLFATPDVFYEFVGQTNIVFDFECFCRNLSLQRYIDQPQDGIDTTDFVLFLNIHPHVLLDKNYHSGETLQLLRELGIQPQQVVFELTERSAVTDFEEFERVLSHYRAQGYRIAIDDVGSGYNSLKTLIYLKPEFIKIDRSLVQNIDQNRTGQQLIALISDYAEQSQTKIIAEGIERVEELKFLQEMGIHYAQGYALGKPSKEIKRGYFPE